MNAKSKGYTKLFMLTLFLPIMVIGQAKLDKAYKKAEAKFEIGDYKGAESALEKFKSATDNKLGKENKYSTVYLVTKAKYALVRGLIPDFENYAAAALKRAEDINTEDGQNKGRIMMEIGELYSLNGSFQKSREILSAARKILENGKWLDESTKARIDIAIAECMTGQGFFNEAIELLTSKEKYYGGRTLKQDVSVDEKGNLKTKRLDSEEIRKRFSEYSRWITDFANVYRKRGNLVSADSAFVAAGTWISRNLGTKTLEYSRNQFLFSNLLVENGLRPDMDFPRFAGYDLALANIRADHKSSHVLALEISEQHLKRLLAQSSTGRYKKVMSGFDKVIKKKFPKESIYRVRMKAVNFDLKVERDKIRNIENEALSLLASNSNLPRNHSLTAETNQFLYELAIRQKNYKAAEGYLKTIIEINENLLGKDAPETHISKLILANYFMDYTNNLQEALKIYEESYEVVVGKQIGAWHKDHLDILNHLGTIYEITDNYAKSAVILEKAGDLARSKYASNDPLYGAELIKIANLRLKLGQYEKAESDINQALIILEEYRKETVWKGTLIGALETQAKLFGLKGLFNEAELNLDRTATIIRKSKGEAIDIDELSTANELASLFIQLGRYNQTDELLNKLILEYEKLYGSNSVRLIEPLVNKGNLFLAKGDYTEANKIAQRAYQTAVSVYGDKSTKTAPTQKLLGDIHYTLGDYEKSEDFITRTLHSQQNQFGNKHLEVAKSLSQLGMIKFSKGDDHPEIERMLYEAREIIGDRLGKDNPQYAEVLKNIAVLDISEKKYPQALNSLTQAETIWSTKTGSKNNIKGASIYALTGDVYYHSKNYSKAENFYNLGKEIYEKNFSRNHPEYVKILSKLGKVYFMTQEYKKSKRNIEDALQNYENYIKQFFPALSEREKAKYWNTIKGDFEFYNTLAFSQLEDFRDLSGKVYNYQLLTKALLLSSSIKIRERIANSTNEELKSTYNDWLRKKEILTQALSMSSTQLLENEIDPSILTEEVEDLEKELSEKSEIFGQSFENKKITYENVQKSLAKNDVAVEIVRYRNFDHTFTDSVIYVALFVKADNSRPKAIRLPEGYRMETRYFKYYRNSIISKMPDQLSYKVFWEPIQKELSQFATIYISPDGVYNQINLESIPTPDGKYVLDNSNIVIVSNTKDIYLKKIKSKMVASDNNATMVGNPSFYASVNSNRLIADLPGTEKEVAELERLLTKKGWKISEYTENMATEERVKELDNPKIFHIATHGFYTPVVSKKMEEEMTENESMMTENPLLKSGLLLKGAGDILAKTKYNYNIENGVLTAYEAMSLNLDKTDLVVLSACETGLGEISNGEGVYGLQRAFLVAGAKVLIMSMFKVDDEATQKLILNFYSKWLISNNLRQSFIEAKKELRKDYPEPIYWGAFMMIGLE